MGTLHHNLQSKMHTFDPLPLWTNFGKNLQDPGSANILINILRVRRQAPIFNAKQFHKLSSADRLKLTLEKSQTSSIIVKLLRKHQLEMAVILLSRKYYQKEEDRDDFVDVLTKAYFIGEFKVYFLTTDDSSARHFSNSDFLPVRSLCDLRSYSNV